MRGWSATPSEKAGAVSHPFPTIWTDGTIAAFWLKDHVIRVPIKLGSKDNREHVIRWLYHEWPFTVMTSTGTPMLVKKVNGEKILLHKVYAELFGHTGPVEAKNGNFLHWSVENIGPRRQPDKIVSQAQQDHEVEQQMFLNLNQRDPYGLTAIQNLANMIARLPANDELLTTDQSIGLITRAMTMQREAERILAATTFTRGKVDALRMEERQTFSMPRSERAPNPRPGPDGECHVKPTRRCKPSKEVEPRPKARQAIEDDDYNVDVYDRSFIQRWRTSSVIRRRYEQSRLDSRPPRNMLLQGPSLPNNHGWRLVCLCTSCALNRAHPTLPPLRCALYHNRNGQAPTASMPDGYVHQEGNECSKVRKGRRTVTTALPF
jgi:hypothetical protein